MRMSCNGCRVLRKGCSDNCSIRPCLQWIKSPDSQAHATVFLAKFYGRAGLMNLINAGPDHLRPAIFRSLLYEACGRIVNPIYGSVGLLWSGSWHLCQAAVEAVLKGDPIIPINSETAFTGQGPPFKAYDIRHVTKDDNSAANDGGGEGGGIKPRSRVRRVVKPKPIKSGFMVDPVGTDHDNELLVVARRSTSHESSVSHQSAGDHGDSKDSTESMVSVETAEASMLFRKETDPAAAGGGNGKTSGGGGAKEASPDDGVGAAGVLLELTLGLEPMMMTMVGPSRACHVVPVKKRRVEACEDDTCKMELGLEYPA